MKTNQVLQRDFMGAVIRQNHLDQYFNVNDITILANKYRKNQGLPEARWDKYIGTKSTKEFFHSLMKNIDNADIIRSKRGKGGETWVHPYVFLDYAVWLSPDFKVKMYEWVYDNMAIFRDDSGESYKKMTGIIADKLDPSKVSIAITIVAQNIKKILQQGDSWNTTSPENLKKRDSIHKKIILMLKAGVDINTAQKIAFEDEGLI